MFLTDKQIEALQRTHSILEGFIDWKTQLQPNGFDLTVREVHEFLSEGSIDFTNEQRTLPETRRLCFKDGWLKLVSGAYKISTNEVVRVPRNVIAFAFPRSSLLRMGAFTAHAVWDAGFYGRGEFLLTVENPYGIRLRENARVAQLVFFKLSSPPEKVYFGIYRGKK